MSKDLYFIKIWVIVAMVTINHDRRLTKVTLLDRSLFKSNQTSSTSVARIAKNLMAWQM